MKLKRILAAVLSLCIIGGAMPVSAGYALEDGDVWSELIEPETSGTCGEKAVWNVDTETGLLTISGEGAVEYGNTSPWSELHKEITAIVVEEGITSIPESVFSLCYAETVDLPATLTEINGLSLNFIGLMPKVTEYRVAAENPAFTAVDGVLFNKDMTTLLKYPTQKADESYTVPETVKTLSDAAFIVQRYLTSVTLPDGLETISEAAFYNCKSLAEISIPASVTEICGNAFPGTPWLAAKQEEDPLVVVNDILVNGLAAEGEIAVPNGIRRIAPFAFENNEKITSVILADSVESIGKSAFFGCTALTEFDLAKTKEVGVAAFVNCSGLTEVDAPEVNKIDMYAFGVCEALEKITIHDPECEIYDADTTICTDGNDKDGYHYDGVIAGVSGSTAQAYAEKYGYTFEGFKEITENRLTFRLYADHAEVTGYDDAEHIGESAGIVDIPAEVGGVPVTVIGEMAFAQKYNLFTVKIPDTVTTIGNLAFWLSRNLHSVNLPDSITSIGASAFDECDALNSITLPGTIDKIEDMTFYFSGLNTVEIPESVKSIGRYGFAMCSNLSSVTILNPECVIDDEALGVPDNNGAFTYTGVIRGYKDSTAQAYAEKYGCTFEELSEDCVTVAEGDLTFSVYPDHAVLELCDPSAAGKITVPVEIDGKPVTEIAMKAFAGCGNITSVELPDSLRAINGEAFRECAKLGEINLPEGLEEIGMAAFLNCGSLKSATLPDSLDAIAAWTFKDCVSLEEVHIPEKCEIIEQSAFDGCGSLKFLTIPALVGQVNPGAFDGCTSLEGIAFFNDECNIYSEIGKSCVIYGNEGSAAQAFAEQNGNPFKLLSQLEPKKMYGDVNSDKEVNLNDAVAIMQYVALPAKYGLSEEALELADVVDNGTSGVNGTDALALMMVDAGLLSAGDLPVTSDQLKKAPENRGFSLSET